MAPGIRPRSRSPCPRGRPAGTSWCTTRAAPPTGSISMSHNEDRRMSRAPNRHLPALALAVTLALAAGCGQGVPAKPNPAASPGIRWNSNQPPDLPALVAQTTGALAFRVDIGPSVALSAKALPESTARVTLQLVSDALPAPFAQDIMPNQFANGAVLFTVHTLPVGLYTISARVKDGADATLAAGSTTARVVAGTTSPVTLLLSTAA